MDPRITRLADIVVNYSVEVQPGDWVVLSGEITSIPLIDEIARLTLEAGGHPSLILTDDGLEETLLRNAGEEQLQRVSPITRLVYEEADVYVRIFSASNTRARSGIDPQKQASRTRANRALTRLMLERSAAGSLRWNIAPFPCQAYAQEADMGLLEYEDFVFGATFADHEDPVAHWQALHVRQERLIEYLKGKDRVQVRGPNVDLALSVKDRTFINSDGKYNMPDGEIYTGPVEDSVNGWVRFSYPALREGVEVEGVEFQFIEGKVTRASARKNDAYLQSQLDSDSGARYLGEFAIGTNYGIRQFTKNILFDEKIGGTIHMAVGAGYPETGSLNRSAVHWDFICSVQEDSEILVDGELFYRNGEFLID